MELEAALKEIHSVWMESIHRGTELTEDEINYILTIQKKVIEEQQLQDGLDDEELEAEYCSNHGIDIFGDKKC